MDSQEADDLAAAGDLARDAEALERDIQVFGPKRVSRCPFCSWGSLMCNWPGHKRFASNPDTA